MGSPLGAILGGGPFLELLCVGGPHLRPFWGGPHFGALGGVPTWGHLEGVPIWGHSGGPTLTPPPPRLYPVGLTVQRYPARDVVLHNYRVPAGVSRELGGNGGMEVMG